MITKHFEDTSSTSPDIEPPQTDAQVSTSLPADAVVVRKPGNLLARRVPSGALALGEGAFPSGALSRNEATATSSTAAAEVDPNLLDEVRELFEQGASDFFHDGVYSDFSRRLLRLLTVHGISAFRAIAEYLYTGDASPDVVSEALRWLADFGGASTLFERWIILRHALKDSSPRVRDGAILGFGALDDPRATPLLLEARNVEQIAELRTLIDKVVAQLGRAR